MQYTLTGKNVTVSVESAGAELVSVLYKGRERLWQNENGSWASHAPVLFPVCGNCGVTVNGKKYPIRKHGFAKRKEFTLVEKGEKSITFSLSSDAQTREVYPYDFTFYVTYDLTENGVTASYKIVNTGEKELCFFCGGHDSFALDDDVGKYKILFEKPEDLTQMYHDDDGCLTGECRTFGRVSEFVLPQEFLREGRTVIFGDLSSRAVTLATVEGKKTAKLTFRGFPHLLLWRPEGARMICIEPWGNLPDRAGEGDGEFVQKRGVCKLLPSQERVFKIAKEYFD